MLNLTFFLLILITSISCGQTGKLYLSDEQIIQYSKNSEQIIKAKQRLKKQQQYDNDLKQLLKEKQQLTKQNKDIVKINLQILKIKQQLGQMQLTRQEQGVNQ